MTGQYDYLLNYEKKNESVLKILWYSVAIVALIEIVNGALYHFLPYGLKFDNYFVDFLIRPLLISLLTAALTTVLFLLLNKKHAKLTSYIVVFGYIIFICSCLMIHYGIHVMYSVYILPILLTVLFSRRRFTILTALVCAAHYLYMCFIYLPGMPPDTYSHNYMDFSANLGLIIIGMIICLYVMHAFNELMYKTVNVNSAKNKLEKEVQLDSFTKLYNRAYFDLLLESYTQKYHDTGEPFTLLVLDLDTFKLVNDTYGHDFGDSVILNLVKVIREDIRATDRAFRFGGEEFAVILETRRAAGEIVAEKIRKNFNNCKYDAAPECRFSVSIGVYECSGEKETAQSVFAAADKALFKAKRLGKNRTVVADGQDI